MKKDPDKLDPRRVSPRYEGATPGRIVKALFKPKKPIDDKSTETDQPEEQKTDG